MVNIWWDLCQSAISTQKRGTLRRSENAFSNDKSESYRRSGEPYMWRENVDMFQTEEPAYAEAQREKETWCVWPTNVCWVSTVHSIRNPVELDQRELARAHRIHTPNRFYILERSHVTFQSALHTRLWSSDPSPPTPVSSFLLACLQGIAQ
jgi:hypothetical protein